MQFFGAEPINGELHLLASINLGNLDFRQVFYRLDDKTFCFMTGFSSTRESDQNELNCFRVDRNRENKFEIRMISKTQIKHVTQTDDSSTLPPRMSSAQFRQPETLDFGFTRQRNLRPFQISWNCLHLADIVATPWTCRQIDSCCCMSPLNICESKNMQDYNKCLQLEEWHETIGGKRRGKKPSRIQSREPMLW